MLSNAYPNPFNPGTNINFVLPNSETVQLKIYNSIGQLVRTLIKGEVLEAGRYTYSWDGRNNNGNTASSGFYIIRITAGRFQAVKKAILLK